MPRLNPRSCTALLTLVLSALAVVAPAASAADNSAFDLAARQRQQAWLWEAPRRQSLPAVQDKRWPLTAEDRFILHRLEQAGLAPAARADDRTWLRRVHFVITGLPPGPGEIQAFLADTRPGARERAVDRLLASPHYGERWARHWMDLVRYAESRGHEGDYLIANAWHYRDYLIRAFNEDVPYDQFLLEHLAGDLLPRPRLRPGTDINESVLATGWAFLGEEIHSPVDIRLDECERIDNQVDVFSKTFLGLTLSCARCHDHKFDPIRAQDYYAMSGFFLSSSFRQVRFEAMENNRTLAAELAALRERYLPRLAKAVAASHQDGIRRLAGYLAAAQDVLSGDSSNAVSAIAAGARPDGLEPGRLGLWVDQLRIARTNTASPLHPFSHSSRWKEGADPKSRSDTPAPGRAALGAGSGMLLPAESRVLADFTQPGRLPWKVDGEAFGSRPLGTGDIVLGNDPTNPVARVMPYGAARRDLFWSRIRSAPGNQNDSGKLGATSRAGQMLRTPTFTLGVGKLHYLIRGRTRVYVAVDSHRMIEGPLHGRLVETFDSGPQAPPRWVTHDLSAYGGHRAHVEFAPEGAGELEVLMVVESAEPPQWRRAREAWAPADPAASSTDAAREFQRAVTEANREFARAAIAKSPQAPRQAALVNWMLQHPQLFRSGPDAATMRIAQEFLAVQSNLARRVRWESQTALAWFDGTGVDEHVLLRGKPFQPGAVSPRSLPAAFPSARPIITPASSGRYELARQLIDPSNPLVARTAVNRVWHHVFGRGIVASVDNFGALGDRPTHPELLDHVAWRFVHEDRWSLKRLLRRLVLTQTFAMSSRAADGRAGEIDPANALWHRMPIRRLEGEVIRDAMLAVSGRLHPQVGGPPVSVHLTEFLVGRGRPEQSGPLDGEGRRSLYTGLRRNFLPTLMQTFDTPTPFTTVGRRNVSNVPAQALARMNDALFHEQAALWAERLQRELPQADGPARVRWLFETAYGRLPTDRETGACLESLAEFGVLHQAPERRDVEAWTAVCHALLNANEFIFVK